MHPVKRRVVAISLALAFAVTGCGPSQAERAAQERARLDLEERTRREAEAANKAITKMNEKMFRQLTPEERAKRDAERARQVKALTEEFKKAEADTAVRKQP